MSRTSFMAECVARTISPEVALENEAIVEALRDRDDAKVLALLDSEF